VMLYIFLSLINLIVGNVHSADVKNPIVLQKDKAGRPFYIDKDGDRIIIIDFKTRQDILDASKYRHVDASNTPVDPKSFYKESAPSKIIEAPKASYKTYTIEEGDTWESISLKLFGVENRWPQLKIWNENLQTSLTLPVGAEMRYIEDKK
ncbi:MAG: LysM peptidoglycan-binding domain-containing protein, partial [Bdellovibrionales bacterium]|nr:LysM peptidoglycan-binding domain-containing protein [Bdellovibrionales bacterium]